MTVAAATLRKNRMMAHLMDALSGGDDIGHYGRLVFVMVARYFLTEDELFRQLQLDTNFDDEEARALIEQVASKGYSPPIREKVLEFQTHQQFPICLHQDDPDECNVYKDLKFPTEVYERITEYHIKPVDSLNAAGRKEDSRNGVHTERPTAEATADGSDTSLTTSAVAFFLACNAISASATMPQQPPPASTTSTRRI